MSSIIHIIHMRVRNDKHSCVYAGSQVKSNSYVAFPHLKIFIYKCYVKRKSLCMTFRNYTVYKVICIRFCFGLTGFVILHIFHLPFITGML